MAKIARNMAYTEVHYSFVEVVDGAPVMHVVTRKLAGNLSTEKAKRLLRKRLGDDIALVVISCKADERRFEMDIERFMELADETDVQMDSLADAGPVDDGEEFGNNTEE